MTKRQQQQQQQQPKQQPNQTQQQEEKEKEGTEFVIPDPFPVVASSLLSLLPPLAAMHCHATHASTDQPARVSANNLKLNHRRETHPKKNPKKSKQNKNR
jgi:hypothetical protein